MGKANLFTPLLHEVVIAGEPDSFNSMFIIMSREPEDLTHFLNNPNNQPEQDHAVVILYNLLCAINFLHSANIMHRDIKPANILINSNCQVKICDFGFSRTY